VRFGAGRNLEEGEDVGLGVDFGKLQTNLGSEVEVLPPDNGANNFLTVEEINLRSAKKTKLRWDPLGRFLNGSTTSVIGKSRAKPLKFSMANFQFVL